MKLNTLEYFVALAESESINKAAQKLYVPQPSLTKALQSFEKELGAQLFIRNKQGITLTEVGKKILPEAKQVLKYYNGWKAMAEQESVRQIDIYTQSVFSYFLFPDVLLRVRKSHPELEIGLSSMLKPGQYISRNVNRPVLCLFVCSEKQLETFTVLQGNRPMILLEGEYHCLIHPDSPLTRNQSVGLEELKEYYLAMGHIKGLLEGDNYGVLQQTFRALFEIAPQQNFIEVGSLANAITLIRKNPEVYTFAFYPVLKYWNSASPRKVAHRPLRDQDTKGFLCLYYPEEAYRQHPAVRDTVKAIRDAITQFAAEAEDDPLSADSPPYPLC